MREAGAGVRGGEDWRGGGGGREVREDGDGGFEVDRGGGLEGKGRKGRKGRNGGGPGEGELVYVWTHRCV